MRKLGSDAAALVILAGTRVRRSFARFGGYRFTGSAVLLVLALVAIATDVADRFGSIPFALLVAMHLRRVSSLRGS